MFSGRLHLPNAVLIFVAFFSGFLPAQHLHAAEAYDSLYSEIESANRAGSGSITLTADISLTGALPRITGKITIDGDGNIISAADAQRVFLVDGGELTIRNITLSNGYSPEDGGAILLRNGAELFVENATFSHNRSDKGGGAIATNSNADRLIISDSSFYGNVATSGGGAILLLAGSVEVSGSSFYRNVAGRFGGAIETFHGIASIANSTIYDNEAGSGGGIYISGARTTLTHLTLLNNRARGEGDALYRTEGRARLRNSIVAGSGETLACVGALEESVGNFSHDGSCAPRPGGDPLLAEATGSPSYFPLLDRSPAVDAADPEFCLETDQTGGERPLGGGCDIGAFESPTARAAVTSPEPPSVCTLSDQILAANTNTAVRACPAGTSHDIITLTKDITLTKPLPLINGTITIEGNGHTISGDNRFRIFTVIGRKLTIKNLTLTEGYSAEDGGAILLQNGAELVIENATFSDSRSDKGGGAISTGSPGDKISISNSSFVDNSAGSGGGAILVIGGTVDITGSSFQGNAARRFGGGLEAFIGRVSISNSTFYDNEASEGGGIKVSGAATTMTHLTLLDNRALWGEGDGVLKSAGTARLRNSLVAGGGDALDCAGGLNESAGNVGRDGSCALLPSGDPMLADATGSPSYFPLLDGSPAVDAAERQYCLETDQAGNARPQGGGCDAGAFESATATPPAPEAQSTACTLSNQILAANANTAVGGCPAGTSHDIITLTEDVTLSAPLPEINGTITIEGNGHTISGDNRFRIFLVTGRKLTINNLKLTRAKTEGDGGAILVRNNAELVVNNSTFESNHIESVEEGDRLRGGYGGAISTVWFSGRISVNSSEFIGNSAEFGGGAININGGTARIVGSTFTDNRAQSFGSAIEVSGGQANIENSTFSRNHANNGGAISISDGTVTMTHLTMLDNESSYNDGAAIRQWWRGTARLRNSVVSSQGYRPDCDGIIDVSRGNFSEDGTCGTRIGGDPQLEEMTGSPGYFPPADISPVVDAADSEFCLETDQTGQARPIGGGCDIGAVEWGTASEGEVTQVLGSQASAVCNVTTTHVLNFRDAPNGARIGAVPANTKLVALGSASGWFNVEHSGRAGWISGDYVTAEGDCS